jgi:galactose mutarotase-like enzyme
LSEWDGEKYCIKVRGIIEEGFLFRNKLRLERVISSVLGESVIHIHDKITNFGNRPSPFTILYHMNLGYPFLSENTELIIDPSETIPRDTDAVQGLNEFRRFIKPQPDFKEQVFYHKMKENNAGDAEVTIRNQMVKIAVTIKFNIDQLPYITQWKMMGCGEYVLGIEPCNIPCKSRNILRKENILPFLQPGESKTIDLEIIVSDLH